LVGFSKKKGSTFNTKLGFLDLTMSQKTLQNNVFSTLFALALIESNQITDNIMIRIGIKRTASSSMSNRFREVLLGVIFVILIIVILAGFAATVVSTTNSLTTGATPVISGGGAAILNQTGTIYGVVIILSIVRLLFVGVDLSKRGRK